MRILVLTSVYPPLGYSGHDERCRQAVRALAQRGHQIQVLTSNHRLPPMGVNGEKGVFREMLLSSESDETSMLGRSYSATFEHEHHNAETLDYRLGRFKPDVVYVWNMRDLSKSLLFRLQDDEVKVVYDLHSNWLLPEEFNTDPWYRWWYDNPSKRSALYRGLLRKLGSARRVFRILPIAESNELSVEGSYVASEWLREELVAAGNSQVKEFPVIYPSIDTEKLTPKVRFAKTLRFMWAGRLNETKGVDVAIDAVAVLKARGIKISLDLFGMGKPSERKAKRARIIAAGLIDQITMHGIRPGEMVEHYTNYDALLYTNLKGEPFSITVLEAMYSKLPCVVANIGGNQELLEDGETALIFEAGSAEALADKIVLLSEREDAGRALAESLIERLQDNHTATTFCEKIEPILALET